MCDKCPKYYGIKFRFWVRGSRVEHAWPNYAWDRCLEAPGPYSLRYALYLATKIVEKERKIKMGFKSKVLVCPTPEELRLYVERTALGTELEVVTQNGVPYLRVDIHHA